MDKDEDKKNPPKSKRYKTLFIIMEYLKGDSLKDMISHLRVMAQGWPGRTQTNSIRDQRFF